MGDKYPSIESIIDKYITDKDENAVIDYYTRQFARLHAFPTCLGKAIDAYDQGRYIDPEYREKMQQILVMISQYFTTANLTEKEREDHLLKLLGEIRHLRLDILQDEYPKEMAQFVASVFSSLSAAFPPALEHVHRRPP